MGDVDWDAFTAKKPAPEPTKIAWYVPLLRWCRPGRFVLEVILGRSLGNPWGECFRVARLMSDPRITPGIDQDGRR